MKYGIRQKSLRLNDRQLFRTAKKLGFDGVELSTLQNYPQDRLWQHNGPDRIRKWAKQANIEVFSVSLSAIRDYGFLDPSPHKRKIGRDLIRHLLRVGSQIGIKVVMLPLFLITANQLDSPQLIQGLVEATQSAKENGIFLAIESFLAVDDLLTLIEQVQSPFLRICVDVGINASCGYNIAEVLAKLRNRIAQIHIKDNVPLEIPKGSPINFSTLQQIRSNLDLSNHQNENGSTKWSTNLGEGNVNFPVVREALLSINYNSYLILETPPGDDPPSNALRNLVFLQKLMK